MNFGIRFFIYVSLFGILPACSKLQTNLGPESTDPAVLRIGVLQEIDPIHPMAIGMVTSRFIKKLLLENTLVGETQKGTFYPSLCEALPIPDPRLPSKVTCTLKAGAAWGDQTPVTEKDFDLALKVGQDPKLPIFDRNEYLSIKDIHVDDGRKITFELVRPDSLYLRTLSKIEILPSHLEGAIYRNLEVQGQTSKYFIQSRYLTEPLNRGLYSGLFHLESFHFGTWFRLQSNRTAKEKIQIRSFPSSAALINALKLGELDATIPRSTPSRDFFKTEKQERWFQAFEFDSTPAPLFEHLIFRSHVLSPSIRRYLRSVLPREAWSRHLEGNDRILLNVPYPGDPSLFNLKPKSEPRPPKFTPEVSEYLLVYPLGDSMRARFAEFLQAFFKKHRVRLILRGIPARTFFTETLKRGEFDLALYSTEMASGECGRFKYGKGFRNFFGSAPRAWENTLRECEQAYPAAARGPYRQAFIQEYWKEALEFPLWTERAVFLRKKGIIYTGDPAEAATWRWDVSQVK